MKKIKHIFIGWYFMLTNQNNHIARRRLAICAGCEFRRRFLCGECGCVLNAKARLFEEECPKKKWPY